MLSMKSGNVYLLRAVDMDLTDDLEGKVLYELIIDQPDTDKVRELRSWWETEGPEPEANETYTIVSARQVVKAERRLVFKTIGGKKRGRKPKTEKNSEEGEGGELDD